MKNMKWYRTKEGLQGFYWGTLIGVAGMITVVAVITLIKIM